MRSAPVFVLFVATVLFGSAIATAEEAPPTLQRTVEFRDGSVLTVTIADTSLSVSVRENGAVQPVQVKLSELDELAFALKAHLDEATRITQLIKDLGDDDFTVRENAEKALRIAGASARMDIEAALAKDPDPETKVRLARLLQALPPASDADIAEGFFDRLAFGGKPRRVQADAGSISLSCTFLGRALTLSRTNVARIRIPSATVKPVIAPAVMTRISDDTPEAFGKNATRIDFEAAPDGTPLTAGMDIGKTFVSRGVTLETSIKSSYVSVNNYDVRGPSRGNSCANQNPLWNGMLTIRFCAPGQAKVPAGVTRVGFWIAEVSPNGTALEAYDAQDRRIAEIKVIKNGNDFLGVQSTVPIAYIKVVPNLAIDPDYTIDDLIFDPPRPFTFVPHEKLFTIFTRSGDKLLAKALTLANGKIHVGNCSVGIDTLELPVASVANVITPTTTWNAGALLKGCWLKLRDGSVLHAGLEDGPVCTRVPLKLSPATLAALWGDAGAYIELPAKNTIPEGGGVYIDKDGSVSFSTFKFGKSFIDEPHFTAAGDPDQRWSNVKYETASTVWLGPDPVIAPDAGRLQLLTGETFVLGQDPNGFVLEELTDRELVLKYAQHTVRIPLAEVLSISMGEK